MALAFVIWAMVAMFIIFIIFSIVMRYLGILDKAANGNFDF
jgi:hypothetical protein